MSEEFEELRKIMLSFYGKDLLDDVDLAEIDQKLKKYYYTERK